MRRIGDPLYVTAMAVAIAVIVLLALDAIPYCAHAQTTAPVTLIWTAPGDDGSVGRASVYTMRRSTVPVAADTSAWWNSAALVLGLPAPSASGAADSVQTTQPYSTTYFYLMQACDDGLPGINGSPTAPGPINCSGWSNVLTVAIPAVSVQDIAPPRRISDLRRKN